MLSSSVTQLDDGNLARGEPNLRSKAHTARRRGWSFLSAVLITLALLLAPVAILAGSAKNQLTSTDTFVSTLAPLASDPEVQQVVSKAVAEAVKADLDIEGTVAEVFAGLDQLPLPPRSAAGLAGMEGPVVLGLNSLVASAADEVVASEQFARLWEQTLRITHTQLTATLSGDPAALAQVGADGSLRLQLQPIVAAVKHLLIAQGVGFARLIPDVERSIVIVDSGAFGQLSVLYGLVVRVGTWLPWASLALMAAGVLMARRRRRALRSAAAGLALVMVALASVIAVGRAVSAATLPQGVLTRAAVLAGYDAVLAPARDMTIAVGCLAVGVVLVAWLAGPGRSARLIRDATTSLATRGRSLGEQYGLTTGRAGTWLDRHHRLLLVTVAAGASVAILLIRPLSAGLVVGVGAAAFGLVLALEFTRRPEPIEPDGP